MISKKIYYIIMSVNLQLKKFDVSRIRDDQVVVLIGKRGTGKSFLTKDILYYHRDIPLGTVISGTEGANHFYSDIIPKILIHEEYSPLIIANFMKRQKKMLKRIDKGEIDLDNRAFLIFDDCLYDDSWKRDKNIRGVFMNGRHYKIFYILTMQYPLGIPPNLRTNIDYVFILRENIMSNRKRIYEHYAGMFPSFEMFCSTMDQCTENFECLVIDNNSKGNKIEDQVYWYKAEEHRDFKMCPSEVWRYSEENFVEDDEEDEININTYHKSRKGPKLNIKKM
jgi:hypothetical protein